MEQRKNDLVLIFGILIFVFFGIYSYFSGVHDYILDSFICIILILFIYFLRNILNLNWSSYLFLIFAISLHLSGVFGFYNQSPVLFQWDHITHFIGIFAVSVVVYGFFKNFFKKDKLFNFFLLLIILLVSLGVGTLIEQVEYMGYLKFGTGSGLLRFGGPGDTPFDNEDLRAMDIVGGGWINTVLDLNYNLLGGFFGIVFMLIKDYFKNES